MRNNILILIVLLALTACNFPLSKTQATPDVVGTRVAQAKTQTATAASVSQQTQQAASSATMALSATPTGTPTSVITETPTTTPTTSDPAKLLGTPAWDDPMDNGKAFGLDSSGYNDGYAQFSISNGVMVMTSLTTAGYKEWRLTDRSISNYYLEGTFKTNDCSGSDQYGLVFRVPDYSSGYGYYLTITCDGTYSVLKWDSNGTSTLVNAATSDKIKAGSNQTNRIGVMVNGSDYTLYFNGEKIQEFKDSAFGSASKLGVFITGYNTSNFTVDVDKLDLWNLK
jgi:Domain of Unknown Function (DUF1080)